MLTWIANETKQVACFAYANQEWLALNHSYNIPNDKRIRCLKRIACASESIVTVNHISVFHEFFACFNTLSFFDTLRPRQLYFSHVRTVLPGQNQY